MPPTPATRARAKFYGDAQERVTALAGDLLFFELELNRLDDARLEAAMATPALGHYRPWLEDIRKEKPHQLADDIEQLFLEKSVSGAAAWNRLFDETMAALRFDFEGESLTLEPLLGKLQDPDEEKREAAANALAATLGANLRLFSLITNTLAKDKEISDRWRKFADVADSRHLANRVEREVVDGAGRRGDRRPIRAFRIAITRSRRAGSARSSSRTGIATRRCPTRRTASSPGRPRATPCSPPMAASRRAWPTSRGGSSTRAGSTRRCGPARRPAPSPIRRRPRRIPTCSSIISASRAT